ncbi:MAG TPA: GYD domain-containing protein [Ktedonobacterales bacterium]|nr:GYD domain-containing protein [Ktedonobacterales bacterium]
MATYVTLVSWTEQGVKNAQETTRRAREFRSDVERRGGKVLGLYWTQGRYDLVVTVDFPDEQAAMAELLALGRVGNVRTETLRAFDENEMEQIIRKI